MRRTLCVIARSRCEKRSSSHSIEETFSPLSALNDVLPLITRSEFRASESNGITRPSNEIGTDPNAFRSNFDLGTETRVIEIRYSAQIAPAPQGIAHPNPDGRGPLACGLAVF